MTRPQCSHCKKTYSWEWWFRVKEHHLSGDCVKGALPKGVEVKEGLQLYTDEGLDASLTTPNDIITPPPKHKPARIGQRLSGPYKTRKDQNLPTRSLDQYRAALLLDYEPSVVGLETVRDEVVFDTLIEGQSSCLATVVNEEWLVVNWDQSEQSFSAERGRCQERNVSYGFITKQSLEDQKVRLEILEEMHPQGREWRQSIDEGTRQTLLPMLLSLGDSRIGDLVRQWQPNHTHAEKMRAVCNLLAAGAIFLTSTPNGRVEDATVSCRKPKPGISIPYFIPYERMVQRATHHPYYNLTRDTTFQSSGSRFIIDRRAYEVLNREDPEDITLSNIETGELYRNVRTSILDGRDFTVKLEPEDDVSSTAYLVWLKTTHPKIYGEYERRKESLDSLIQLLAEGVQRGSQAYVEEEKRVSFRCGKSRKTLGRWMNAWAEGRDRGLISKAFLRGPRGKVRADPRSRAIALGVIVTDYLNKTPARGDIHRVYLKGYELCVKENLTPLSLVWYHKTIAKLDRRTVTRQRLGSRAFAEMRHYGGGYREARFPLHSIMADHKLCDVWVASTKRDLVARSTVSVAFEVFTSMLWSIYIGLGAPRAVTTALLIRMGVLKKDNMAWGIPSYFYADWGSDFASKMVKVGCTSNDIMPRHPPPGMPWTRGLVEGTIGATDTALFAVLPGYVPPLTPESKAITYCPKVDQLLTLPELEQVVMKYFIEEYPQKPNSGLHMQAPIDVWNDSIGSSPFPPQEPPDLGKFDEAFLSVPPPTKDNPDGTRTISKEGHILLFNEKYHSDALDDLPSSTSRGLIHYQIRFDAFDMSKILLYPPDGGQPIPIYRQTDDGRAYDKITLREIAWLNQQLNEGAKRVPELRARKLSERRALVDQMLEGDRQLRVQVEADRRYEEVRARTKPPNSREPKENPKPKAQMAVPQDLLNRMRRSLAPEATENE